jgi:predicted nucleotidyltransferase
MTRHETIAEITRTLVGFYRPYHIYLFGSAARGDSGPDSDLDFRVVLPGGTPASVLHDGEI